MSAATFRVLLKGGTQDGSVHIAERASTTVTVHTIAPRGEVLAELYVEDGAEEETHSELGRLPVWSLCKSEVSPDIIWTTTRRGQVVVRRTVGAAISAILAATATGELLGSAAFELGLGA